MHINADGADARGRRPSTARRPKPALRGPTRSSQPPHSAAETPSTTKNSVYIQPMLATFQSQVVVNSSWNSEMSGHAFGAVSPIGARQRQPEHRKAIGHADAQMDAKRGGRHQPAIEAGGLQWSARCQEAPPRRRSWCLRCEQSSSIPPSQPPVPGKSAVNDPVLVRLRRAPHLLPCTTLDMRRDRNAHTSYLTPPSAPYARFGICPGNCPIPARGKAGQDSTSAPLRRN